MNQPETTQNRDGAVIETLAAVNGLATVESLLKGERDAGKVVFAETRLSEMAELSRALLQHPALRRDPAAVALGFWLRPANLGVITRSHVEKLGPDIVPAPAGLVFHIAPANVDTMFVYSWALSYLAGNANIVRLSTGRSPLVEAILQCLRERMQAAPGLWQNDAFITYEHHDAITARISLSCDLRAIWGGDETVRRIRSIPLHAHASERVFGSKLSFAVLGAAAFMRATETEQADVLRRLLTDLTPFDQKACSSPHCVYWLGSPEQTDGAIRKFDAQLARGDLAPADVAQAVRRVSSVFEAAVESGPAWEKSTLQPALWTLRADAQRTGLPAPGDGVITHVEVVSVDQIAAAAKANHQTIGHWGLDQATLHSLAQAAGARGVDRIVPVGKALAFDNIWDGGDLLDDFVRKVRLWV